jgi:hypothetical protein
MQEVYKNAIWEFLNDYDPYGIELMRLKRNLKKHYKKG